MKLTLFFSIFIFFSLLLLGCINAPYSSESETNSFCKKNGTDISMNLSEARAIAAIDCRGTIGESVSCNSQTGAWWFSFTPETERNDCYGECVVSVESRNATINWQCLMETG